MRSRQSRYESRIRKRTARKKHIEEMADLSARREQEHAEAEWRQAATLARLLDRLEKAGSGIR
jgi:hypothetical protein